MEIRGATIHPSLDRSGETKPQGYFFAGHIWIDDNIRRMSLFTGYDVRIVPLDADASIATDKEDAGLITFSRTLPGWNGQPVAKIVVHNDSPIIRELNRAGRRLFLYLNLFAVGLLIVLALALNFWIRRPLRRLTRSLHKGDPALLAPLQKRRDEFGRLAELILKNRETEDALALAEDRLRHAQKLEAVGRLAGGVAHDFNNLLTAIMGYSELLEARLERDGTSRDFARQIRITGERAASLTKQLLAFSRRQLLMPKVLDLNVVVGELETLLQRVIGEHIRIQIQTRAAEARVRADRGQLEQVILNLGVNARDAMPKGGLLTIATENRTQLDFVLEHGFEPSRDGYVLLVVSDTGCGMDAATKDRIFEPFFTTKAPGKGTGLGLATVYGIVKQSGGGIAVESEPMKGSKFTIYFPRETSPLELSQPDAPALVAPAHAETLLVVEDEEVVRQLICAVLTDVGYTVLCAASPSEAVRLSAQHSGKIEMLVTDIVMPEMHGPTLAQQIVGLRPDVKVLYVSGYSENDISDQGVLEPGLDVLQKPFSKVTLLRKVRDILDGKGGGSLD
jgi:signal transduction histidine kinase